MNFIDQDLIGEFTQVEIEENINNVSKQRQLQRVQLLQKIEELYPSSSSIEGKDQEQASKLNQYVFSLYTHFECEWIQFTEQGDQEIGNCYKYCINKLNIFKNILRAFFSYMKNKGDDIVIECLDSFQKPIQKVKKQFIRFSERHPANNKSMTVLFEYDRYGRQFEYFLNFYAVDWLLKSKVKDIIPHLLSIFFLLRCFKAPQLKEQLKVYKKTKKITLPRKIRKSTATDACKSKEMEIKEEEEPMSLQTNSLIPSSDSLNGTEENKNESQYSLFESQSSSCAFSSQSFNYYNQYPSQSNYSNNYFDQNDNDNQSTMQFNSGYPEQDFFNDNYLNTNNIEEKHFISLENCRNSHMNDQNENKDCWLY